MDEVLSKDILKVLLYIKENKHNNMYPYLRTICSFINNNHNSPFVNIYEQYPDISSKKYDIDIDEIKNILLDLIGKKYVYSITTAKNKDTYHLSKCGKLFLENIKISNSWSELDVKHMIIGWAKKYKILDYRNPLFIDSMFNLIIEDRNWRNRTINFLNEMMNVFINYFSPYTQTFLIPKNEDELCFSEENLTYLPGFTRHLKYNLKDFNINTPAITSVYFLDYNPHQYVYGYYSYIKKIRIRYSNDFKETYLKNKFITSNNKYFLSLNDENVVNYLIEETKAYDNKLMDYFLYDMFPVENEWKLRDELSFNYVNILLPDYSFNYLRYPDIYSFKYWLKKDYYRTVDLVLNLRYFIPGKYKFNNLNSKYLCELLTIKNKIYISSSKKEISSVDFVKPNNYYKIALSIKDPTALNFDSKKDIVKINDSIIINESTVLYLIFLDENENIIRFI